MVLSQLFLTFVFLLTGSLAYADAPLVEPEKSEVALEGEVSALDAVSQQLTLRAQRFSLPNGRSSSIAPAKLKKVVLTKTRFIDDRTGKPLDLNDLRLSQVVRVIGKSSVANGPFQARVITWKSVIEKAPANPAPSEADEGVALPAIAPLLPPSQSFNRLNLRIVDAGFASPASFSGDNDTWTQQMKWTGFYFSYRASSLQGTRPGELVRFRGLYGPQNMPISEVNSTSGMPASVPYLGGTFFFRQIDPKWKSVRAEFEVQDPSAPSNASGKEQTAVTLSDIVLPVQDPANPNKEVEVNPNLVYTSPRGVKYTLSRITSSSPGNYKLTWDYLPPAGLEDLKAEAQMFRITDGAGSSGGWSRSNEVWNKKSFEFNAWNVKKDAKKIGLSFRLIEQSRAWRSASAFKRLSFNIPVKPVVDAVPIVQRESPSPFFEAKGQEVALRWEVDGSNWSGSDNMLWLRDTAPANTADKSSWAWLPREVKVFAPDGKGIGQQWNNNRDQGYMLHSDNMLRSPSEASVTQFINFENENNGKRPPNVEVRIKVERAQTIDFIHRFENVPLPSPGQSRDFTPDEFSDETLALRRITWVRSPDDVPEARRGRFRDMSKALLLLTFDRTRVFPEGNFRANVAQLKDETGQRDSNSYSTFDGDPMGERSENSSKWTLQIEAPFTGSKLMGLLLNTSEIKWSGKSENLTIPNMPVPPRPN